MSEEKKSPPVIWLQDEGEENHPTAGEWYEGATWCEDAINDGDVKYIRADIAERYRTALDRISHEDASRDYTFHELQEIAREALHPTQPAEGTET